MKEKINRLIQISESYIGTKEIGVNSGEQIELFQRAVDGKSQKEPWCAAFVWHCINSVDNEIKENRCNLYKSEHVLTIWNKSNRLCRRQNPCVGDIVIWQFYEKRIATTKGHCGIVYKIIDKNKIETIEGNTSPDDKGSQREGDGVFKKTRQLNHGQSFVLKGFLIPWR